MTDRRASVSTIVVHADARLDAAGRVTLDAVAGLIGRGRSVLLAVPADGPLTRAAEALGADTTVTGPPNLQVVRLVRALALLARARPEAVLVRAISMPAWVIAARVLRLPIVTFAEGPLHPSPELAVASLSTRVLLHTERDRDDLIRSAPRCTTRTCVVQAPVAGPTAVVPAREHLDGRVRLLVLGTDATVEGAAFAAAVTAILHREGVDVVLEHVSERLPAAGMPVAPWAALADADIVLVPSRDDPRSRVAAVQGVLAGRPVVVSAVGGLAESVEGFPSAVSVVPGDPAALADAVRRIVGSWSAFRRTAAAMAPIAAERHRADRYGAAIALVTERASRSAPAVALTAG